MTRTFVIGVGLTTFDKPGKKPGDYPDWVREAGTAALRDAGVAYEQVGQAYAGYVYGDSTAGQRAVYELGLTGIPVVNVNNNCATGSTALYLARQAVAYGVVDCALAVGFERMQSGSLKPMYTDRTNPLQRHIDRMSEIHPPEPSPFSPQLFGNAGRAHMERYGSRPEHFAWIAWKNHKHGDGPVVNPSGGLIAKGHPLGATGLAQCAELTWQLRGDAGPRQVGGAHVALQHNLGLNGAAVVTVYERGA
ncbi:thiolase C-terminal domain-containing protein [Streptomyces rapamycinicus]|uniref:propanoyl-CoA C-acyltransferase n=2 Tax=Streptomyces rapamycinicus TaxID=1226757 RepID=A0A0A0N4W2_STRRN|nr:beta-ketoacyl synthase N-terminal-like domain-containing protein [Streptomyces rapamycinicus]AGP51796.1 hypothetical protein M271_00795 [Streptomyces rapamycinicus NRRL 5491]MBB4779210.1 sterol carrier protein 2 [Streptomyces rapamycinicus]RLV76125.1 hypothetical protein D3C57_142905 [Streptomyces rapamycinicus NRRL 5491]UTP28018.1 hypothetical protein LIV37_00635 [Streptomyces rapamycinicus NRRL 5491]